MKNYSNLLQSLDEKKLEELEQQLSLRARRKLTEVGFDDYFTWVKAVWLNSRGEPLDFSRHKYLLDIYQDQHPSIVYQKPAQSGISERLISEAVWICDRLGKMVLYTFPTSTQLADFVQARLEPVFQLSDYLSQITGTLSAEEERERNLVISGKKVKKVGLKKIRNAFLYLRGSQNQQQIISVDADTVFLDERDRFMQEHVPYIDKRLLHSNLKWRREASTPTFPNKHINEAYLQSDQRIWMLTCGYCNLEQELDFFQNIDYEKRTTICRKCKKPIDRLKGGRWVIQNSKNTEVHGYKINGLCNPQNDISAIIDTYEKAKITGVAAMQQFYNQVLGLPYEAEGQKVLITDLNECQGDYDAPLAVQDCFGGADVGERINVIVSKKINNRNRYVWIGTVKDFLGPVDSLEWLIDKFNIRVLVVDVKPDTRKVDELIKKFPNRIYAAYYPTRKFDVQNYYIYDDNKFEVYIDRTISLDYLVADIHNRVVEIPRNAQYLPGFYDQMTSSIRELVINPRNGQPEPRWVERSADHFYHAANYNRIAVMKGGVGQALLDSYKQNVNDNHSIYPTTLTGWMRWINIGGKRVF